MEESSSSSSATVPDVYVFDCDNEAEPYWQMMVEFLSTHFYGY